VRDCQLAWFEEPVTADDKRGLAEVRRSTHIPIASGESDCTRFDFRDLIDLSAADVLQPDLAICGGITEAMRIGAMAAACEPARGAAPVGRRAGLRRRPAFRSRLPGRRTFWSIRSAPTP
jgi:L-alanine-DL-glutamate epimerase-like enolase superfamily enzyme